MGSLRLIPSPIPLTLLRALPLLLALLLPMTAGAQSFDGFVTHVSDGDTIWVRPAHGGPPQSVRLHGIDAPELCQPGGTQSRDALADRVRHKRVHVHGVGRDDYGRVLARVEDAEGADINRWLVRTGQAWSYRFRRDAGPYAQDQRMARQSGRGLWRGNGPMEPRVFRRLHGACS